MKMKALALVSLFQISTSCMAHNKTIICDFDGTIADSWKVIAQSIVNYAYWAGFRNEDQSAITKHDLEKLRHMEASDIVAKLGMNKLHVAMCCLSAKFNFWWYYSSVNLISGIKEMLQSLNDAGFRLVILSSNSKKNIELILNKEDIAHLFERIQCTSIRNIFNKSAEINTLLSALGIEAKDAIYIGDEIRDLKAVSYLRLKFIGAGWKEAYNTKESLKTAAESYGYVENSDYFIADSPEHITQVLLSTH